MAAGRDLQEGSSHVDDTSAVHGRVPADYRFACSQAQLYAWIKERRPELWKRICAKIGAGQLVPVGATWVEPDCNIPSGESLLRQFLHGQRFFEREFGHRCLEFWNPDVFGYNGQLPQIMRESGVRRFLTQKLSWNRFNKPEYHTFTWQGIDGSDVLVHFPPADTYNAEATVTELRRTREATSITSTRGRACSSSGMVTGAAGRPGR